MSWRKFLIVPRLVALGARAPREQAKAWDLFWSRVRRTGKDGDALWDLGSETELAISLERMRAHLDLTLPVVDLGCGNGRQTRALASSFPLAIGVDLAPAAIANIRDMLGDKGSLYVVETDFDGDALDHLEYQGASAGAIPEPLRLCIASGVRPPMHFSEKEMDDFFPRSAWTRVVSGPAALHTLPMHNRGTKEMDELSAYYAVVRPKR